MSASQVVASESGAGKVTVVIPVHNRADLLARLLRTVTAQTVPFAGVLAMDNGSTDGAGDVARNLGCTVVPMGGNLGFARAVNAGWRMASTEWVAILNSDVELDRLWLERLLEGLGAGVGFATGLILQHGTSDIVDGTYDLVSRSGCAWRAGHGQRIGISRSAARIGIASGTACLFRRSVLEQLGGFDERYGSYMEDVDLGLRCVRTGIGGIYVPAAIAWHRGSATFGRWDPRVVRLISRNQTMLVARLYDRELVRDCLWQIFVGQILWGAVALRHGAGFAWFAGKWEALRDFRVEGTKSERLRKFFDDSEIEIRKDSRDPFWRWYFRLAGRSSTGAPANTPAAEPAITKDAAH